MISIWFQRSEECKLPRLVVAGISRCRWTCAKHGFHCLGFWRQILFVTYWLAEAAARAIGSPKLYCVLTFVTVNSDGFQGSCVCTLDFEGDLSKVTHSNTFNFFFFFKRTNKQTYRTNVWGCSHKPESCVLSLTESVPHPTHPFGLLLMLLSLSTLMSNLNKNATQTGGRVRFPAETGW